MERIRQLLQDTDYREYLAKTAAHEKDRQFCRHDQSHAADVARIAWIICLEEKMHFTREVLYAAAFLHDLGRFMEYDDSNVNHAVASAGLARSFLLKHRFLSTEADDICTAIAEHRLPPEQCRTALGRVLAMADDLSRRCWACIARDKCYKYNRMNTAEGIVY